MKKVKSWWKKVKYWWKKTSTESRVSNNFFMKNGSLLLEERISLFHGKTNFIRFFSATELNAIITSKNNALTCEYTWYNGVIDGRKVLIRFAKNEIGNYGREIAVGTEMNTHNNGHKLLGCCLETEYPVLIFEWVENGSLYDQMNIPVQHDGSENYKPKQGGLEWKDRLRIAWEISHAVAYLHTAFPRPIIHRDIKPSIVFLDHDNVAKLSNFRLSISIPQGKTYVEDDVIGTFSFIAPDYCSSGILKEKVDVYSFGVLLLVLLTGRNPNVKGEDGYKYMDLVYWVMERAGREDMGINQIIDPRMNIANEDLHHQAQASMELALRCIEYNGENRPTMVEVATQLKNIISPSELPCP